MGCLKCTCTKKLEEYCCVSCLIWCCIVGLGWGTFLLIFSVTYEMSLIWKILSFFWGVLVFAISLIFLVVTLHELFKRHTCLCQKYSMGGNSGDLSVHEQAEPTPTTRNWNIFSSKRSKYSVGRHTEAASTTQTNCHALTQPSVQLNSENKSENRPPHFCFPNSQTDRIQEDISLESHSSFLRTDDKRVRKNRPKETTLSTQQCASIKLESHITACVQTQTVSTTVNSSSPHKQHFRYNLQATSEISFDVQNAVNMILMADSTTSSDSDIERHIYADIDSSYEEEHTQSDYEYIEPLPPRRPPPNTLNNALAANNIPSGTCMKNEGTASDVEITSGNIHKAELIKVIQMNRELKEI